MPAPMVLDGVDDWAGNVWFPIGCKGLVLVDVTLAVVPLMRILLVDVSVCVVTVEVMNVVDGLVVSEAQPTTPTCWMAVEPRFPSPLVKLT